MIDIKKILDISIALSSERDYVKLLDKIIDELMDISSCDAATLYLKENNKLNFFITRNKTLNEFKGGSFSKLDLPPLEINENSISGYVALNKKPLNIKDVYSSDNKFSGPKKYDALTGYHTKSVLVVPLMDRENNILGVIQLLNAKNDEGNIVAFDKVLEDVIFALSSETAVLLNNKKLYDDIKGLLDSFVEAMVKAIESRTPYNAFHTINVAKLCVGFSKFLKDNYNYDFSDNDIEELRLAAMLHDIGKIITPLNVLNKATRFEPNIPLMKMRWNLILACLKNKLLLNEITKEEYDKEIKKINNACEFIIRLDTMGFVKEDDRPYIDEIISYSYDTEYGLLKLIDDNEVDDAHIIKGTLTKEERYEIEKHVVYTSKIIENIKFGDAYSHVKYIAGAHHEYLDGSGYPNKLKDKDLDVSVRIITICDVYESLTSTDRPYKKPIPKDIAYRILTDMVKEGKLDNELVLKFKEFIEL